LYKYNIYGMYLHDILRHKILWAWKKVEKWCHIWYL